MLLLQLFFVVDLHLRSLLFYFHILLKQLTLAFPLLFYLSLPLVTFLFLIQRLYFHIYSYEGIKHIFGILYLLVFDKEEYYLYPFLRKSPYHHLHIQILLLFLKQQSFHNHQALTMLEIHSFLYLVKSYLVQLTHHKTYISFLIQLYFLPIITPLS